MKNILVIYLIRKSHFNPVHIFSYVNASLDYSKCWNLRLGGKI